ncbi:IS91 family transposase [Mesorhizobium waimense]|uniref:IS91 family transposase n=1 Tax=Mesorhizobium waimense TaxID=1300307 RepID=A0A3A5KGT2_9HYPH|nr:IS91 family transposase [Mesorhizobium waimense]RJT35003.1 IS91 family transposase [Mesorhizobium waimense]
MARSGWEVADIFRRYGETYRAQHGASLSTAQRRVMTAIELCRTAALGGHVEACDQCGHQRIAFNSCRDRHCVKCQSLARAQWLDDRRAELLDTQYFHVVFTLPEAIAAIAYQNKAAAYAILFRAAAETLRTIAADPRHLGAEIGFFAVLHTWGQTLVFHPHLHCVVAGGGLSANGERWIACRPGFFLPVRVLSRLFRRLYLQHLEKAFEAGELQFFSDLKALNERSAFLRYLAPLRKAAWVVYAKPPFAGPETVLDYVGRYTHRVAIANNRLVDIEDGTVRFRWKDYRHHGRQKIMTVSADEFIRRFLLHVLPDGFHRIRYYGFLGNRHRAQKLARCRALIGMPVAEPSIDPSAKDYRDRYEDLTGHSLRTCPVCHQGQMIVIETFDGLTTGPPDQDTS